MMYVEERKEKEKKLCVTFTRFSLTITTDESFIMCPTFTFNFIIYALQLNKLSDFVFIAKEFLH